MSKLLALFFIVVLDTVTHCRVTFTHSEVLQETDLDGNKQAKFKCPNGCIIYSNSQDSDMYITDGKIDYSNFLVMGATDRATGPVDLLPWNDYYLEYRGKGAVPRFVFYVVDKKAPYIDTPVHAVSNEVGFLVDSSLSRRFTLLRSFDPAPVITFEGEFEDGYPRIYATGYDATSEDECTPVYTARSQESALNSWLTIASPILTVDKGPEKAKAVVRVGTSAAFDKKPAYSSVVYKSPGYVGCSYIKDQIYSTSSDTVLDSFSADGNTFDFFASLNIPTANEAVHLTVNNEKVDLYGNSSAKKHYEAASFDVTISWIRNFETTSNFAIQFDLGVSKQETTTKSARGSLIVSSLLTVFLAMR